MRDYAELQKDLSCCAAEYTACMKCKHWGKSTCSNELCGKAADAIEELLAAVPRWISVEERLPDVRHSALVTDGEELYLAYYYYGLDGTHHWDSPFQPTHWMPLPNPPGGERK